MKTFRSKVAAVTGAGSGIGRALALQLASEGASLALSDLNPVGLAETVAQVAKRSPTVRVTSQTLDVAQKDAVFAWADAVVADHGRVNLIFNNAGVGHASTVAGTKLEDFEWIMSINFWGVVYGTLAFLPKLEASGEGHVINTSSVFGLIAFLGNSTYNASKFAVRGYTEGLRQELEFTHSKVSATCVHPGGIRTNIAQATRMDANLTALGIDDHAKARRDFEKHFHTLPETAAAVILNAVRRNKRRVLVGMDAKVMDLLQRFLPGSYHPLLARLSGQRAPSNLVKINSSKA